MDSSAPKPQPLWQQRRLWLLLLMLTAVFYYASYYRYGINFRDEGGTTALNGQRLLEGQVPFNDVDLGYNVGWFAPIVGLFKITGVSFVAARIFFLVLAALTALMAFLTVERIARYTARDKLAGPLAFAVGLLILLVPGMIFKNYNPLAVVANAWCLVGFILADDFRKANWRALVGGLILGTTWVLRIDLGTFFSVLWLGVLLMRLPGPRAHLPARAASSAVALLLLAACTALVHAPILWDASRRNYTGSFLAAYPSQWREILRKAPGLTAKATPTATTVTPQGTPANGETAPAPPEAKPASPAKNTTQARKTWAEVSKAKKYGEALGLWLLTYAPLLLLLPLVAWSLLSWAQTAFSGGDSRLPLTSLTLLGCALTLFPHFFLWRPDAAHLSEFGPGYFTAIVGAILLLGHGKKGRGFTLVFTVLLVAHAGIWMWRMFPDRWCGSIAARWNRDVLLETANGISVYEQDKDVPWMKEMVRLIQAHSRPGEYLVAYPYHPTFNVMANRPTYEKNVYIDNAKAKASWSDEAIGRLKKFDPAVIIYGDWDINGTEESRFKNWAGPFCDYLSEHYELLRIFDEKKENFRLYVRKPAAGTLPPPVADGPPSVDEALSYALEAAKPFSKDFAVRENYWGGDMAVKQAKAISHQLFKGNEYWFWLGTDTKEAKVSVHVYDGEGNLCEEEYRQKGHMAMVRSLPKRTGAHFLVVEVESSPKERTKWGMAYGYR